MVVGECCLGDYFSLDIVFGSLVLSSLHAGWAACVWFLVCVWLRKCLSP